MAERYYAYVYPDPKLVDVYADLLAWISALEREGRVAAAFRVREIHSELRAAYTTLGIDGARKADQFIRERLRSTAVRGTTSGRLARAIKSRPLPTTLPGAAIGIASIDMLNAGAVSTRTGGGIYWRAQEYGLPATPKYLPRTKRHAVPGYFMPGMSAPSDDQFRNHPFFQQFSYDRAAGDKAPPALVRKRALAARRFLERGSGSYLAWDREQRVKINRAGFEAMIAARTL